MLDFDFDSNFINAIVLITSYTKVRNISICIHMVFHLFQNIFVITPHSHGLLKEDLFGFSFGGFEFGAFGFGGSGFGFRSATRC